MGFVHVLMLWIMLTGICVEGQFTGQKVSSITPTGRSGKLDFSLTSPECCQACGIAKSAQTTYDEAKANGDNAKEYDITYLASSFTDFAVLCQCDPSHAYVTTHSDTSKRLVYYK